MLIQQDNSVAAFRRPADYKSSIVPAQDTEAAVRSAFFRVL
jgi:hypothetical protein